MQIVALQSAAQYYDLQCPLPTAKYPIYNPNLCYKGYELSGCSVLPIWYNVSCVLFWSKIPRDLTQTASCIYCDLQDYSEFQITLIVHDYNGTSTQMECSDVRFKISHWREWYTFGSCG